MTEMWVTMTERIEKLEAERKQLRAALANIKTILTELPNGDPPSDMADAIAIAHLTLEAVKQ